MESTPEITILNERLALARPLFIGYLQTILDPDNEYWDDDTREQICGIRFDYEYDDLNLLCYAFNGELEDLDEEQPTGFFTDLFNETHDIETGTIFLPEELQGMDYDGNFTDAFEQWVCSCWQEAFNGEPPYPGFISQYDAQYYTSLDTGELGDHLDVLRIADGHAITEENIQENGLTLLERRDGMMALRNANGELIMPFGNIYIAAFKNGLAMVRNENNSYGIINEQAQYIIPPVYSRIFPHSLHEGLISAQSNGKWGFIDEQNQTVIPFMYSFGGIFRNGVCAVPFDGKHGIINRQNEIVIPFMYDNLAPADSGLIFAKLNDKWGIITRENKTVAPFIYDDMHGFYNGYAQVTLHGEKGYIDGQQNFIPGDAPGL